MQDFVHEQYVSQLVVPFGALPANTEALVHP